MIYSIIQFINQFKFKIIQVYHVLFTKIKFYTIKIRLYLVECFELVLLTLLALFFEKIAFIKTLIDSIVNHSSAWRSLKAYDRLGNAVLNDDDIQTISERAAKARLQGKLWGCYLCKILDKFFDKNHCDKQLK